MNSDSTSGSYSYSNFERMFLITQQISEAFICLTNESKTIREIFINAVERKDIASFSFYAMRAGKAYAELTIRINWKIYDENMMAGRNIIKISTKFQDGILPVTSSFVERFAKYVENNNFQIEWQFTWSEHIYNDPQKLEKARKQTNSTQGEVKQKADNYIDFNTQKPYVRNCTSYGLEELEFVVLI